MLLNARLLNGMPLPSIYLNSRVFGPAGIPRIPIMAGHIAFVPALTPGCLALLASAPFFNYLIPIT